MLLKELSTITFENMIKHLVEVEEGKRKILDEYFPDKSSERIEIENLINNYIKHIDGLISQTEAHQADCIETPFVTIGSEVEVIDLSNQDAFTYRIVNPYTTSVRGGSVSFLSPVGKALLLKKVGDELEVKAPGGMFYYKINAIQFPA